MQYIRGTKKRGLEFKPGTGTKVHAWIDASHNVHPDAKGHTGLILTLGEGPSDLIAASSSKQKMVARSSYESELIGVYDKYPLAKWALSAVKEWGYESGPIVLYQDNQSAMHSMQHGPAAHSNSSHLRKRLFWIQQELEEDHAETRYKESELMLADPLTKANIDTGTLDRLHSSIMKIDGDTVL